MFSRDDMGRNLAFDQAPDPIVLCFIEIENVQVLRGPPFGVNTDGVSTDHEVFNAVSVERE